MVRVNGSGPVQFGTIKGCEFRGHEVAPGEVQGLKAPKTRYHNKSMYQRDKIVSVTRSRPP